jgi:hypothetical protein
MTDTVGSFRDTPRDERFWAELRVVEFCKQRLETAEDSMVKKQEFVGRVSGRPGEISTERKIATHGNVGLAGCRC